MKKGWNVTIVSKTLTGKLVRLGYFSQANRQMMDPDDIIHGRWQVLNHKESGFENKWKKLKYHAACESC